MAKGKKQQKKLARRIRDYDMMMATMSAKVSVGAFHKPGSNKK